MSQNPAMPSSPSPSSSPASERPQHHVTVTAINWAGALDFVHLFRVFRVATKPNKLCVAIMGILLIYLSGWAFDLAWGPQATVGELDAYQNTPAAKFRAQRALDLTQRNIDLQRRLTDELPLPARGDPKFVDALNARDREIAALRANPRAAERRLVDLYEAKFHAQIADAANRRKQAETSAWNLTSPTDTRTPAERELAERQTAAAELAANVTATRATVGKGIFATLLDYELQQFDALIDNTLTFVRVAPVRHQASATTAQAAQVGLLTKEPARFWQSDTLVGCLANMTLTAPCWLFSATAPMQWRPDDAASWSGWTRMTCYRVMYLGSLVLLATFWLTVIAFTGAIICRLAALDFAGSENATLPAAWAFARARFTQFLRAPLMPFAILLAVGLFIAGLGLLGAIPGIGEVLLGLILGIALLFGFVAMLLIFAIVGGFNLIYPTLAVEGSDCFDAMSRSFAYVYGRPWRLVFYTLISLVYGVVTFLFMALVLYLVLAATHTFLGWGTNLAGYRLAAYTGEPKLDTLWPAPHFGLLLSQPNWWAMSWPEWLGASLIHIWLFLAVATLAAFAVCFYHCANTMIYLLLRRSVDGQPITDVYEEPVARVDPTPALAAEATPPAASPSPA